MGLEEFFLCMRRRKIERIRSTYNMVVVNEKEIQDMLEDLN